MVSVIAAFGILAAIFVLVRIDGQFRPRPMKMGLEQFFLTNPIRMRFFGPAHALNLLGSADGLSVLEVGVGVGVILQDLAQRIGSKGQIAGLDIQPQALEKTRRRLANMGYSPDLRLGTASKLPWADGCFERVVMITMLGEVPADERVTALKEMARVLNPGGFGIVTEFWPDPHYIREADLREYCRLAQLEVVDAYHAPMLYSLRLMAH
jgi:ubiquinone/menaquinone biosynthesis C-methylase UbiE